MRAALLFLLLCLLPIAASAQCVPTKTLYTQALLTWDAPAPVAGVTLTNYTIDQRIDTGAWAPYVTTQATQLSLAVVGLLPGHTYEWRLRVVAQSGGSNGSSDYAPAGPVPPCLALMLIGAPGKFQALPQP